MNKFKFDSWHGRSAIMSLAVLGLLVIGKLPAYGNNKLLYLAQTPDLPSGVDVDNLPATPLPDVRQDPTVTPLPPAEDLLDSLPNQSPEGKVSESEVKFEVQKFELKGNTVLEKTAVDNILRKYSDRPIGFTDLLELETELTKLYTARGYINSGVVVPIQDVNQGKITLQAIEGKLETINVEVDGRLKPSYVRSRLARGAKEPLNIETI
ncbi:MAG: hypothetical protein KME09_09465 [Pleurocapsa minor HA4230-MV1]|jgi:hemolysin activation/secretion protein|nr:hypothetical protein [Pleurocapsa minor HA4230-MV1]